MRGFGNYKMVVDSNTGWWMFSLVIIAPVFILFLAYALRIYKELKASYFVKQFAKKDPVWNEQKILDKAEVMFYAVNNAWLEMNFTPVLPFVTENIKLEWIQVLKSMKKDRLLYNYSKVKLDEIVIIGAMDDVDNNRDWVQVKISGYMRRYFRYQETNRLTEYSSPGYDFFSDLYTFKRYEDEWLLDKIEYFAGFTKIMTSTIKGMNR
jgi:hypothetical protein